MYFDIKSLLPKSIKRAGINKQIEATQVLEMFNKVVKDFFNDEFQRDLRPLYIKNKILTVACLSSIIAQELYFKEKDIIARINKSFGQEIINKIKYLQ